MSYNTDRGLLATSKAADPDASKTSISNAAEASDAAKSSDAAEASTSISADASISRGTYNYVVQAATGFLTY
jgi:hypothetical protein